MTRSNPHFLLVGNGPYTNRGCEAIVRGTVIILRRYFGAATLFTVGSFGERQQVLRQAASETDPLITHVPLLPPKWSYAGMYHQFGATFRCGWSVHKSHHLCLPKDPFSLALEVGGDNYSLEYGVPYRFLAMDRHLQRRQIPVVLWGASIGPFDSRPAFEDRILAHLHGLDGVFAREGLTFDYLRKNGLGTRAHHVADPAFVMPPTVPSKQRVGFPLPKDVVGINLSPLFGRFAGYTNSEHWVHCCAATVCRIANETCRDVLLVPHVASASPLNDDFGFLEKVAALATPGTTHTIFCSKASLSAAETKGLMAACCTVFAGARTHSTIGAMSVGVPTLTLAYSRKGIAIPFDVFGSEDYCIDSKNFEPEHVARRICRLIEESAVARSLLARAMPLMREKAYLAGKILTRTFDSNDGVLPVLPRPTGLPVQENR